MFFYEYAYFQPNFVPPYPNFVPPMSYSIAPILHTRNLEKGVRKVQIRVIFNRKKYYKSIELRLKPDQLVNGEVVNHPNAKKLNDNIRTKQIDIESRLLDLIRDGKDSEENIKLAVTGKSASVQLIDVLNKVVESYRGRVSENTIHNYRVSVKKLLEFKPGVSVQQCSAEMLGQFEQWLRLERQTVGAEDNKKEIDKYSPNTISKYMQMLKSVLNKAHNMGIVKKELYDSYKRPKSQYTVPVWLTITEIEKFAKVLSAVEDEFIKQAGYYFLLCCYAGYRISDAKAFNYKKAFFNGRLVVRADKNKRIVSMPVFDKLKPILEYCKDNPFDLSEQKARLHVKKICTFAGIKKDVKFHSARHSFGMMLMANGFTIDEAAELLGDTPLVTKVYARVHNDFLDKKILERLGNS